MWYSYHIIYTTILTHYLVLQGWEEEMTHYYVKSVDGGSARRIKCNPIYSPVSMGPNDSRMQLTI